MHNKSKLLTLLILSLTTCIDGADRQISSSSSSTCSNNSFDIDSVHEGFSQLSLENNDKITNCSNRNPSRSLNDLKHRAKPSLSTQNIFMYVLQNGKNPAAMLDNPWGFSNTTLLKIYEAKKKDAIREVKKIVNDNITLKSCHIPEKQDPAGNNPLHLVAMYGNPQDMLVATHEIYKPHFLTRRNNAGQRPIDVAKTRGRDDMVKILEGPSKQALEKKRLDMSIKKMIKDHIIGQTAALTAREDNPLHILAAHGTSEQIEFAVREKMYRGDYLTMPNSAGLTPIDVARARGRNDIVKIFETTPFTAYQSSDETYKQSAMFPWPASSF